MSQINNRSIDSHLQSSLEGGEAREKKIRSTDSFQKAFSLKRERDSSSDQEASSHPSLKGAKKGETTVQETTKDTEMQRSFFDPASSPPEHTLTPLNQEASPLHDFHPLNTKKEKEPPFNPLFSHPSTPKKSASATQIHKNQMEKAAEHKANKHQAEEVAEEHSSHAAESAEHEEERMRQIREMQMEGMHPFHELEAGPVEQSAPAPYASFEHAALYQEFINAVAAVYTNQMQTSTLMTLKDGTQIFIEKTAQGLAISVETMNPHIQELLEANRAKINESLKKKNVSIASLKIKLVQRKKDAEGY